MAGPDAHSDTLSRRENFFERVLHHHATLLYRVAFSVLRNPADAEDAVAEALLKLLRTGAWEGIANERAFLTRSVWHAALDRLHHRPPAGLPVDEAFPLFSEAPSPLRHSMANQQWHHLHEAIEALSAELREPLLLSAVQELNSREISEVLHLPEGTVRTRLMRARAQLRQQLEPPQNSEALAAAAVRGPTR